MEHYHRKPSDFSSRSEIYPDRGGAGAVDRSASIALAKLMSTKRAVGEQNLLSPTGDRSSKPKNLMFNHKHLQYIPLAAHPGRRGSTSGLGMSTALPNNGRAIPPQPIHSPINYHRQDQGPPQLSPAAHARVAETERMLRQQQQYQQQQQHHHLSRSQHHQPVTKSVGVGANLNYTRGGQGIGRPGEEPPRDYRHPSYMGISRYDTAPPPPPPQLPIPNASHTHGLTHHHAPSSTSVGHGSRTEVQTTPQKFNERQGQQGSPRETAPPRSSPGIKVKYTGGPGPGSLSAAQLEMFSSLKAPTNTHKIVSQNLNGTLSVTCVPSNDSELQLFRVLQRANLLNYFDVMIELGGDDVQQLCDAGEDEFLEIMALIGMASKPLHVRRLQKSLQDFITQPHMFPNPILGPPLSAYMNQNATSSTGTTSSTGSKTQMPIRPIPYHSGMSGSSSSLQTPSATSHQSFMETKHLHPKYQPVRSDSNFSNGGNEDNSQNHQIQVHAGGNSTTMNSANQNHSMSVAQSQHSPSSSTSSLGSNCAFPGTPFTLPNGISVRFPTEPVQNSSNLLLESRLREGKPAEASVEPTPRSSSIESTCDHPDSRSSVSPVPFLQDHEIQKIRDSAIRTVKALPPEFAEPKITGKRKYSADFDIVTRIPDEDPKKEEEIRKFATIYARYNCKRKAQKPLTIHELSANEAASQLCLRVPALLTRREDLKVLSREVVRNAGLPYSSIISACSFREFVPGNRRISFTDGIENQEQARPHSAPTPSNLPEDMSKFRHYRPESSPVTTEVKLNSSREVEWNMSKKRAATLNETSGSVPKERKVDEERHVPDDLSRQPIPRSINSSLKYEGEN